MVRGWQTFGVIGLALLLGGCGLLQKKQHRVEAGDTLYSIAWSHGHDYREVAKWNDISPPYRIYAGQVINVAPPTGSASASTASSASRSTTSTTPGPRGYYDPSLSHEYASVWRKPEQAPSAAQSQSKPSRPHASAQPSSSTRASSAPSGKSSASAAKTPASVPTRSLAKVEKRPSRPQVIDRDPTQWKWPTKGKVVTRFSPRKGKKGVDIKGQLGQPVIAAADGEVVYSGKGLIGYGNLIIVKHSSAYLSAYGHNRVLLIREGERVKQGQKIAEMGQSPKSGAILHFEIRKNGQPVNPLQFLGK